MNRRLWALAGLGAVLGAALGVWRGRSQIDPLAELFPAEKIRGYAEGTRLRIVSNLSSKSITGGAVLLAEAIAPGPVEPSRLQPTCLGLLKGLLQQRRDADWICIFLAEDSALAATSNWLAVAEYRRGEIRLRGGHPTLAQIDSLKTLGLSPHRPDAAEAALVNEVFEANQGLKAERWRLSQSLRASSPAALDRPTFFRLELDTRSLTEVGKRHGMPGERVRTLVLGVTRYYWLQAGETWRL